MKIQRVETTNGSCYVTEKNGTYYRCGGSLKSGFTETEECVESLRLLPPVEVSAIFVVGLNYREHAVEMRKPIPEFPVVAMKSPASVIGTGDPIVLPRQLRSDQVDYECELAVVIGRDCKNATQENALDYVAGYTAANDVSARDWQQIYSGGQWCKGKSFDSFCPLGPCLVTSDGIANPDRLNIRTELNGQCMQSSNTSDMIFSVRDLIVFLSGSMTLQSGSVILTGTPTGVGIARTPQRFLKDGDRVVIEVEGIGRLENEVIEEV